MSDKINPDKGFVHLHVHTQYSLLDGACRIKKAVSKVKDMGQTALAITDHGVMYGVVEFYKECKAQGIKPIIGCEVYVATRSRFDKVHKTDGYYHLILLCKDQTGYQNLIALVSAGYTEGFYNKPRVDKELLAKHSEGLIAMSACLAGEVQVHLAKGDYDKAKQAALWYNDVFGKDNYYLELQNHQIEDQVRILPLLKKLSKETGIPMAAANDAHYINREDSKMQSILICIQTNTVYGQQDKNSLEFETDEFYLKSYDEMYQLFSEYEGALENTVKIADMCNFDFEFGVTKLPYFSVEGGLSNYDYFRQKCYEGLYRHYGENPPESIVNRLEYEIKVISEMGYVDYYLIVYDFIRYAKQHDIPVGPGRGSGAGSIAAYCIGITGIDPIKYNLLFERFLNPERVSMPDFDIDFCYERRQEVIDYVIRKYKSDHVAQIITFGTLAAKAAVRDVGRALGVPYQKVDAVAKAIPFALGMTIERALKESAELKKIVESDPGAKELVQTAQQLEGMPRHASTHAAGVVITREPASSYVPLQKNDEAIVTQYTMTTLEELGLLKMDFLGLRTLTVISDCEKLVKQRIPEFNPQKINENDKGVFEMLSKGDAVGVFQFESSGMKQVLMQLKPNSIEDLIAVISLYRPGPMDSIPKYIQNRHNPQNIKYDHPLLKPILEVTYGCIVYQEQVMQICRDLAGYSYGRSDLVRRAMAKKKADVMEKEREVFIQGAVKNNVSQEIAADIFEQMSSFASYAFNKSHAAAYAVVAYTTAYLKYHYPKEFMAALLTSVIDNSSKIIEYISECTTKGIKVLPPDINKSTAGFTVCDEGINFGLQAVKNLGKGVIDSIVQQRRQNGDFKSLEDFCTRCSGIINKRAVENLIKCGAMDCLGLNRFSMMMAYEQLLDSAAQKNKVQITGQLDMFSTAGIEPVPVEIKQYQEFDIKDKLAMEKDILGIYISDHPLNKLDKNQFGFRIEDISSILSKQEQNDNIDGINVAVLGIITDIKTMYTKNNTEMAFVMLEDKTGIIETVVFPNTYEKYRYLLNKDAVIAVYGRISVKDEQPANILISDIYQPMSVNETEGHLSAKIVLCVENKNDLRLEAVYNVLSRSQGDDMVFLYIKDIKKQLFLKDCKVNLNDDLQKHLKDILGNGNVIVKVTKKQQNS